MKFCGALGGSPNAVTYAAESPPSTMKSYELNTDIQRRLPWQ